MHKIQLFSVMQPYNLPEPKASRNLLWQRKTFQLEETLSRTRLRWTETLFLMSIQVKEEQKGWKERITFVCLRCKVHYSLFAC